MQMLDPVLLEIIVRRVREDLLEGCPPEAALDAALEDCDLFSKPGGPEAAGALGFVDVLEADRDGEALAGNPWVSLRDVTDGQTTRIDARVAGIRMWLMCFAGVQPDGTVSLECVYKDRLPSVAPSDRDAYHGRVRIWCQTVVEIGQALGARTVEVPRLSERGTFVLWRDPAR